MSQKQKQKRNEYVLISKCQEDFQGMLEEQEKHYSMVWTECIAIINEIKTSGSTG